MQEEKLSIAREHGCDDTVLWTADGDQQKLATETKAKGLNGGFHAIIDFVNTTPIAERNFEILNAVRPRVFAPQVR